MHISRTDGPADWGTALLRISLGTMFLAHSVVLKLLTYGLPGTAAFFQNVGLPGWLAYVTFACEAVGGDTPMTGFARVWRRVVHRLGGLPKDVTPHVLRHSFASLAADLGHADATIAALLGHKGHSITRRYIHSADAALLAAADVVANKATTLMAGDQQEVLAANFQPLQAGVEAAQRDDDPSADVDNNLTVGRQVTATAA